MIVTYRGPDTNNKQINVQGYHDAKDLDTKPE